MELRLEKADGQIPRFSRVGADVASPIPQLSRKFPVAPKRHSISHRSWLLGGQRRIADAGRVVSILANGKGGGEITP